MKLRAGFSENPRIEPLIDGAITIDGFDLEWELSAPGELFHKQLSENCYDVCEFSISDYLIVAGRPDWAHLGWMAVPVFLSKPLGLLLHFYVNENAGIRDYADFRGKRFGMPDYGMTAAVWLRIMLRTLYDIQPSDITWFNGRPASLRHGRLLDIDGDTSTGVKIVNLESTTELNELLQRGEIDAAYGDGVVQVGAGPRVRHFSPAPVLQRLLADFCRASGGATPMNHTVVFKRELLEEDPDFGRRLHEAFRQSKEEAYRRAKRAAGAYLLFPELAFAAQGELFGEDPYPFGLERNRATLNMIAEQQRLDGLTRETADLDRLWLEVSG